MLQTMCLGHFKDFLPQIFSGSILLFCTLPLVCRSKNAEGQAQANGPGRSFHFVNATFPLHGFLPIVPQTGFETLGSLGYVVGNKLCGFVQGRMRMRRWQGTSRPGEGSPASDWCGRGVCVVLTHEDWSGAASGVPSPVPLSLAGQPSSPPPLSAHHRPLKHICSAGGPRPRRANDPPGRSVPRVPPLLRRGLAPPLPHAGRPQPGLTLRI